MKENYPDLTDLSNRILNERFLGDNLREIVNSLIVLNHTVKRIEKRVSDIEESL